MIPRRVRYYERRKRRERRLGRYLFIRLPSVALDEPNRDNFTLRHRKTRTALRPLLGQSIPAFLRANWAARGQMRADHVHLARY